MKNVLKKIAKEFIFGGHMTALQSPALLLTLMILGNYSIDFFLLLVPYLVTQLVYSYNHFREIDFDEDSNPERSEFIKVNNRKQQILFIVYLVSLIGILISNNLAVAGLTTLVLIAGILYTEYFKKLKIIGFKNYYIATVWSSILFILPLSVNNEITGFYVLTVLVYALTAFTNTVFFDVKDIESDAERGIKTFPAVWGLKRTQYMLYFVKLITALLVVLGVSVGVLPSIFLLYLLEVIYSVVYITVGFNLESKKLRLVTYLVAEAEFTFWLIVLAITSSFF